MSTGRRKSSARASERGVESESAEVCEGVAGPGIKRVSKSRAPSVAAEPVPDRGARHAESTGLESNDGRDACAGAADADLHEAVRSLETRLARSRREVELLTSLLATAEDERDGLRESLKTRQSELLTMQHDRNCLAAELERLKATCAGRDRTLEARTNEMLTIQHTRNCLAADLIRTQALLSEREANLSAIVSSRSWRLTWLLRKLRQWTMG